MKLRKELWFGLGLMAVMLVITLIALPAPAQMTSGHYGMLMLALVVAAIMLGFPTAFTLMGMGVLFAWIAFAYDSQKTLDLMVQRAYAVMTNDVLISIPLFVFMGYLVERANLVERLFKSIHLALARLPGSLAVATLVTCAIFATATGIVGAVVTLMGLLAFPAMLRHGYDIRLSAGAITAGGCLGILIPPSVMLIVYGATAGVSVVQLYAGAFFPGLMLTGLYVLYVIVLAVFRPKLAPPLAAADRVVRLSPELEAVRGRYGSNALFGLLRATLGGAPGISRLNAGRLLVLALMPFLSFLLIVALLLRAQTAPLPVVPTAEVEALGDAADPGVAAGRVGADDSGLAEPPGRAGDELQEPPATGDGVEVPPTAGDGLQEPPASGGAVGPSPGDAGTQVDGASGGLAEPPGTPSAAAAANAARSVPTWLWWFVGGGLAGFALYYALLNLVRMEVFRMLLSSFFPLSMLILAVLGSIVFGLATPSEAAAVGALGGILLAAAYRQLSFAVIKESTFLTAKTTAMVCWLFVGSSIFSAAFALLGGQELVEKWVLSLEMTPVQFLILSQCIIFLLGWPLEWTEIIVIFMPIFVPLLQHFHVDPLFFGLLVALNLQTAFLSPPVAMAAFYLKGVAPPHVTLGQIFAGMLPFMGIQLVAIFLLYIFPEIGLWLPGVLYR